MLNQINPQAQVYLRSPLQQKNKAQPQQSLLQKKHCMTSNQALQDITNNHTKNAALPGQNLKENVKPEPNHEKKLMFQPSKQSKSQKEELAKTEESTQVNKSEKESNQTSEEVVEQQEQQQSYTNEELQRMQDANWLLFDQLCFSKQYFDEIFRNIATNFASKIAFLQQKSSELISSNKEIMPLQSREFLSMETSGLFQQLMICEETCSHLYELMHSETKMFHQQCLIVNSLEEIYSIDPRNLCQFTNIIIDINEEVKDKQLMQDNQIFKDFGKFLEHCEHASVLQMVLRSQNLNDEQFKLIFSGFNKFKFLEQFALDVCKNNLSNEGMKALAKELEELVQLSFVTLIFDFNSIGTEGAIALGNTLYKLQNISTLNLQLGNNDITSKGAVSLFKGIKRLVQLVDLKLGLRNNILSDKMFEGFTHQMHNLFYLQKVEIDLYNNSISKIGFQQLNQALLSGNYLFYLKIDIGRNEIEKIASFLKFLKYGNKLLGLKLYLDTNALKSSQLKEIIKHLQFQTELTELKIDCSGYLLTTVFYKELAALGEKLDKLEKLELSLNSCKVSQEKVDLIVNGISKFKGLKLVALSLSDNGLRMSSDTIKQNIKASNESVELIECFL